MKDRDRSRNLSADGRMHHKQCEGVEWFHLAQDTVRFWYPINAVTKLAYLRQWEKLAWLTERPLASQDDHAPRS